MEAVPDLGSFSLHGFRGCWLSLLTTEPRAVSLRLPPICNQDVSGELLENLKLSPVCLDGLSSSVCPALLTIPLEVATGLITSLIAAGEPFTCVLRHRVKLKMF